MFFCVRSAAMVAKLCMGPAINYYLLTRCCIQDHSSPAASLAPASAPPYHANFGWPGATSGQMKVLNWWLTQICKELKLAELVPGIGKDTVCIR